MVRDREACRAAVRGVTKSRTRLVTEHNLSREASGSFISLVSFRLGGEGNGSGRTSGDSPSPHCDPGHFRNFDEGCELLLVCSLRIWVYCKGPEKPVQQGETRERLGQRQGDPRESWVERTGIEDRFSMERR